MMCAIWFLNRKDPLCRICRKVVCFSQQVCVGFQKHQVLDLLQVTRFDYGGRARDPRARNKKMAAGSVRFQFSHLAQHTQIFRVRVLQSSVSTSITAMRMHIYRAHFAS